MDNTVNFSISKISHVELFNTAQLSQVIVLLLDIIGHLKNMTKNERNEMGEDVLEKINKMYNKFADDLEKK